MKATGTSGLFVSALPLLLGPASTMAQVVPAPVIPADGAIVRLDPQLTMGENIADLVRCGRSNTSQCFLISDVRSAE